MRIGRGVAAIVMTTLLLSGCTTPDATRSSLVASPSSASPGRPSGPTPTIDAYRAMVRRAVREHGVRPAEVAAALMRAGVRGRVETTAARSTIGAAMPVVDVAARSGGDCLVAEISGTGRDAGVRVLRVAPVQGRCLIGGAP